MTKHEYLAKCSELEALWSGYDMEAAIANNFEPPARVGQIKSDIAKFNERALLKQALGVLTYKAKKKDAELRAKGIVDRDLKHQIEFLKDAINHT